jgi:hypothetical protein
MKSKEIQKMKKTLFILFFVMSSLEVYSQVPEFIDDQEQSGQTTDVDEDDDFVDLTPEQVEELLKSKELTYNDPWWITVKFQQLISPLAEYDCVLDLYIYFLNLKDRISGKNEKEKNDPVKNEL